MIGGETLLTLGFGGLKFFWNSLLWNMFLTAIQDVQKIWDVDVRNLCVVNRWWKVWYQLVRGQDQFESDEDAAAMTRFDLPYCISANTNHKHKHRKCDTTWLRTELPRVVSIDGSGIPSNADRWSGTVKVFSDSLSLVSFQISTSLDVWVSPKNWNFGFGWEASFGNTNHSFCFHGLIQRFLLLHSLSA